MQQLAIEDGFEDVLGKAISGLGLHVADLASRSGLPLAQLEALLEGQLDSEHADGLAALQTLAPHLGLSASALVDLAQHAWRPTCTLPEGCLLLNTPFPVPGYLEMTVNSYLFWSGEVAAAVDTGANADQLIAAVAQRGLQLKFLLITHTHRDHVAALDDIRAVFPDLAVFCPDQEPLAGALPLGEGASLQVGDWQVEVRETAGHSPGALTYLIQRKGLQLAFVGDAIFCMSMGKAPGAYAQALRNNRDKILSLPEPTLLCPGHGPITSVGEELAHNPFFKTPFSG
jgi:glyoxylase-like metal-dependent hydrolase (beta-lactamase superfamily II)